ncbi:MORN repeat-containing protein 3-like [Athalia rosae]|uniref:MORN repeat-containing protein 3-like n=1 Tax=Athalia rosae TaxID=37344 RepID=UPI002033DAFD|nr:MORN repeat-containing protein 3-like [Athalia rosae]
MPFLKPRKVSVTDTKFEKCKRNGWRKSIFSASWPLKSCYIGDWKNDKKDGKGFQLSGTKWLYKGDWWNGYRHGYGMLGKVLESKEIWKCYIGDWVKGKKQGFGGSWYIDGSYYEGNFWQNNRHGFGRMWYGNGDFYQGMWKMDLHHGDGMLVKANGNRYEGYFFHGKKQGRGIYYHINTGQIQEGCWDNDVCVVGTMEDLYWRQSAHHSTFYPIPENKLLDSGDIIARRENEVIGSQARD